MTDAEQRFIDAWRYAGPILEELSNKELRELDESKGGELLSRSANESPQGHGLAIFQSWMMRLRVSELMKRTR
jgi:hypothetical protein